MDAFIESNPDKFIELIELAILNKKTYSWRAAWLLSSCMHENDKRIKPYIPKLINAISGVRDGHKRDLINILRKMKLNEDHEGLVFDICVKNWCDISKIPSVRWSSLKYMLQIAEKHPELYTEIIFLTQNHYLEPLSPGIRNSVRRIMKEIEDLTNKK